MTRSRAVLVAVALAFAPSLACDQVDELPTSLDAEQLPERFACDDVTLIVAADDGHAALLIGIDDGLAAAARESGQAIEANYELPDERLIVRYVEGTNVFQGQCGRDAGDDWAVATRYEAQAGGLALRIEADDDGELELHAELFELSLVGDALEPMILGDVALSVELE